MLMAFTDEEEMRLRCAAAGPPIVFAPPPVISTPCWFPEISASPRPFAGVL